MQFHLNKTTKDPVQEQISTLGYYKPRPRRNASVSHTLSTQAASKLTSPAHKLETISHDGLDDIERML